MSKQHLHQQMPSTFASSAAAAASDLTSEAVKAFLKRHPLFLENYVTSTAVSKETFQRWSHKRVMKEHAVAARSRIVLENGNSQPQQKTFAVSVVDDEWKSRNLPVKRQLLLDLSTDEQDSSGPALCRNRLLNELSVASVSLTGADGANLYVIDKETQELYLYSSIKGTSIINGAISTQRLHPQSGKSISAHVAKTLDFAVSNDISRDSRFSEGIGINDLNCEAVLCYPFIDTSGTLLGVLELYRRRGRPSFDDKSIEMLIDDQLFRAMNKQRKLNDFLLTVTRSIFQDIVSMDTVIMKVMNFAQKLVNADRASLFLVDSKTNELYARIFDVGTGDEEAGSLNSQGQKEIKFPMDRGIAGFVASTGQVLNIENAYMDDRFNREVDLKTGYITKTILCMPIFIRGQGLEKQRCLENFSETAEESVYPLLYLLLCILMFVLVHHAKLYDKIRRSEQKYRVALEVLAYHSVCSHDEMMKLKRLGLPERVAELETFEVHSLKVSEVEKSHYAVFMFHNLFGCESFDFNALRLSEIEKPQLAVYMFKDHFGASNFDFDDVIRFVLTIRKNYRRVPYHNWTHGWSVAQAMYVILKTCDVFTYLERLSMYIACLCHDLDHRGKNNAFMRNFGTPLAAIYSTSVMEHHHFNQCVTILQQEGHNILKTLSSEDYKWVLGNVKHCILATDLALFFPNKAKLRQILDDSSFSWQNKQHRLLVQTVAMTGCDLIASAKPWSVQTDTVKVIFEEFYEQGDAERANGQEPIPMMDRKKAHELPQMQVGFLSGICVPCYELLSQVLPCSASLVDKCKYNLIKWQELADQHAAAAADAQHKAEKHS